MPPSEADWGMVIAEEKLVRAERIIGSVHFISEDGCFKRWYWV